MDDSAGDVVEKRIKPVKVPKSGIVNSGVESITKFIKNSTSKIKTLFKNATLGDEMKDVLSKIGECDWEKDDEITARSQSCIQFRRKGERTSSMVLRMKPRRSHSTTGRQINFLLNRAFDDE